MAQLEHAQIVVTGESSMDFIPVQFNPTQLEFSKSVQMAEVPIPGLDTPLLQFVRGQTETLTVELFFDTTDQGMGENAVSVTSYTDRIYQLTKIERDRHAPVVCEFIWNDTFPGTDMDSPGYSNQQRSSFKGIVESVNQTFTLFSPEGIPLRAKLNVTFKEYKTLSEQLEQLNLMSPNRTHSHVLQVNETLDRIAAQRYNRSSSWRSIAEENEIEDPRRLSAGHELIIPSLR